MVIYVGYTRLIWGMDTYSLYTSLPSFPSFGTDVRLVPEHVTFWSLAVPSFHTSHVHSVGHVKAAPVHWGAANKHSNNPKRITQHLEIPVAPWLGLHSRGLILRGQHTRTWRGIW